MRLLPGYTTAPTRAGSLVVHRPTPRVATAVFVDAVSFEPVASVTAVARAGTAVLRARTAMEAIALYSSVASLAAASTGRVDVFA